MTAVELLLLIIGIVVLSLILIWVAIPPFIALAKKRGWNIPAIIQAAYSWLTRLDTFAEIMKSMDIPGASVFDKIIHVTQQAVKYAEQIAKTGQIDPEQRYEEAKKAILIGLKLAGLSEEKINEPDVQTIIEIGIESAVDSLGHKKTN
jgi:hypothetical protein